MLIEYLHSNMNLVYLISRSGRIAIFDTAAEVVAFEYPLTAIIALLGGNHGKRLYSDWYCVRHRNSGR